jgi:hypothetical protein
MLDGRARDINIMLLGEAVDQVLNDGRTYLSHFHKADGGVHRSRCAEITVT